MMSTVMMRPMMMRPIVLIRHAETALAGRFCGHSDPDLSADGERQLASVVGEVERLGVRRIYSSDLRRATRTAAAISQRIGVDFEIRRGLREIHFGLWEGLEWEEVQRRYPQEAESWLKEFPMRPAPGGETYADFGARVAVEFNALLCGPADLTQAVVTHRGVMQYALTRFFGFSDADAWARTEHYGVVIVASRVRVPDIGQTNTEPHAIGVNRRVYEYRNQRR